MTHEEWLKEQEEDKEICKHCDQDDCSMCGIRNKDGENNG